ncbi:hypothetical protein CCO03_01500 [Comamonas serinivorans]|uniref:DUF4145 domain-containing protein n=1 Tax=Comamonas serinivorans TaxID=1082851 RepID=A0A1Y0EIS4_9BURK|nr:hypothetical protein [Comamonas serinivorans]ARU03533.1 hypothetical protein CCO03_01500 [Comamonas serinivorans]
MQKLDTRITNEVKDLVQVGQQLNRSVSTSSRGIGGDELAELAMWVTRLGQLIQKLYGEKSQHFASYSRALDNNNFYNLHSNHYEHFTQLFGVAKAIQHDIKQGLVVDFKALVQAEVFADFLDMGEYLLDEGYKDAAAVIIGTVLEDGLRKLSERGGLPLLADSGKPLTIDPLNTQLAKADVYSKLVQKQITSWAHIRNKAAHGEFSEYSMEQVRMMLLFVQNFASEHLA